jgi:hypothetical protein
MGYAITAAQEILNILNETGGIPSHATRTAITKAIAQMKADRRKRQIKKIWKDDIRTR